MKTLALELLDSEPTEIKFLETNEIQGLYSFKDSYQSFWSLKAICELSKFREHKNKGDEIFE